ncbi:uncharacterized protein LOC128257181 [Drosophila gunungcola]|uniref:uncharacterized protein LOC128257181 n=1 Tax=Drosophila gunungcola TaxID=103775 RepID=UPI0022E45B2E|nr:uncharacterized protein LOC128257181 [Drosophila gunungcola]
MGLQSLPTLAPFQLFKIYTLKILPFILECDLGEHLTCKIKFICCWMYQCVCLPNHVYLGLGHGCLYEKFV